MGKLLQPPDSINIYLDQRGFRPADIVTIAFLALFTVMLLPQLKYYPEMWPFLIFNISAILSLFIFSKYPILGSSLLPGAIRRWYPAIVIPVVFFELRSLIPAWNPGYYDGVLILLDEVLFGCQPSLVLQALHWPALTEVLQIVYSTFYFLPLLLGALLVMDKRHDTYDLFYFVICYGFFLSYLGYFFVPAIGPRFTLSAQYTFPLQGLWFYEPLVTITNELESIHRDCYPSGHTMMTLVVLHFCWLHKRRLATIYIPLGASLVFSTIYLRYHYGIDLIAGFVFYLFVSVTAVPVYGFLLQVEGYRLKRPPD